MELISISHLTKSFGKVEVLKDISLIYQSGTIYGLVGENGSGKTTLFCCIIGVHKYNGLIKKADHLKIGYLPADSFFYSLITGMEYIEFCMKAKGEPIDSKKILQLNAIFQLPLERYASEYSTGMKKKLSLIALLLQENDVYILDEPFNGVDLKGCIQLKRLIHSLKENGKTIIISSHQIAVLHEIADSIHYLNNHTIIKQYTHESIEEIENDILSV